MTEPRNSERDTKVQKQKKYYGVASSKGGAGAAAGRRPYREECQLDYGPDLDLDEPSDGTESAHEF